MVGTSSTVGLAGQEGKVIGKMLREMHSATADARRATAIVKAGEAVTELREKREKAKAELDAMAADLNPTADQDPEE